MIHTQTHTSGDIQYIRFDRCRGNEDSSRISAAAHDTDAARGASDLRELLREPSERLCSLKFPMNDPPPLGKFRQLLHIVSQYSPEYRPQEYCCWFSDSIMEVMKEIYHGTLTLDPAYSKKETLFWGSGSLPIAHQTTAQIKAEFAALVRPLLQLPLQQPCSPVQERTPFTLDNPIFQKNVHQQLHNGQQQLPNYHPTTAPAQFSPSTNPHGANTYSPPQPHGLWPGTPNFFGPSIYPYQTIIPPLSYPFPPMIPPPYPITPAGPLYQYSSMPSAPAYPTAPIFCIPGHTVGFPYLPPASLGPVFSIAPPFLPVVGRSPGEAGQWGQSGGQFSP